MARAEDLRAMQRELEAIHFNIGSQLMKLQTLIRIAENGAPPPVLNPGRRRDDMPLPPAPRVDGVQLQVLDFAPRVECDAFGPLPEQDALVFAGLGAEGDDYHGQSATQGAR